MRARLAVLRGLLTLLNPTRRWIKRSPVSAAAPRRACCAVVPGLAATSPKAMRSPAFPLLNRATPGIKDIVSYNDDPAAQGGARYRLSVIRVYLKALVRG